MSVKLKLEPVTAPSMYRKRCLGSRKENSTTFWTLRLLFTTVSAPVAALIRYSLMRRVSEPNEVLSPSGTKTNCATGAVVAAVAGSALDAPVSYAHAVNAKPRARAHVSWRIRVAETCITHTSLLGN